MYWYTYPLSVKIIRVFHANKGKKTELTVNDNPGSVLHQDPIERIEEDASSTYFIDNDPIGWHRKRFSLSCPNLTRFEIIVTTTASNDRIVVHWIPYAWITKDRFKRIRGVQDVENKNSKQDFGKIRMDQVRFQWSSPMFPLSSRKFRQ